MLQAWIDAMAARLPARCEVCRSWPARPVCEPCVQRFAQPQPRCRRCALRVPAGVAECGACLREPPALDTCHAALPYAYPWAGLIGRFKFHAEPGWASHLALLMRSAPWIEPTLEACDLVVPMPLSTRRLAERGFNQAVELARRLAPAKLSTGLLLRVRDTPPQAFLDRRQRLGNMAHAFAMDPMRGARVAGRRVVLVDDVMTSGATLEAAARALRRAGAARVDGLVLARTDLD
jgi:ComF family protein